MEDYKKLILNYNGSKKKIEFSPNYQSFIKNVKEKFNLTEEQCKKIAFQIFFKSGQSQFKLDVKSSDEYETAMAISISYDNINGEIILPKPMSVPQKNINLSEDDELIAKLKQMKKDKIKEYLIIRRKNLDLIKELDVDSEKKENEQEVLNRFKIIEESEQTHNLNKKRKIEKKSNIPDNIKIKNKEEKELDCEFIDNDNINNHIIERRINEISQNNPIKFDFRIKNNGKNEWPVDTILKCETTNTPIFFYYSSLKDNENGIIMEPQYGILQLFTVIVVFKNYANIKVGQYNLKAYLVSDKHGRIGNSYGELILKVLPESNYNNNNNNNNNYSKENNNDNNFNLLGDNDDDNNWDNDFVQDY